MKTHVGYIYERKIMNAKTRYYTSVFKPDWKLLAIMITVLDDENKVVDRRYYKVVEEEKDD